MDLDASPCTPDDLAVLDRLRTPMWIVDLPQAARWWCNRAGLTLWHSPSLREWIGRNAVHPPSAATLTRMESLRRRFERGEVATERWTFYPDGAPAPVVAECRASGFLVADQRGEPGRLAMLVEARPLSAEEVHATERRGYEALRHIGELVSYYAGTGEALLRNPAAIRALGDPVAPGETQDQLLAGFADPAQVAELRARVGENAVYRADALVRTTAGEQWYDTEARAVLDPVTGKPGVLVTQRDIAERRSHVEELERSRELLAAQAEELRNLAAPVIRVGDGVLALPLIGKLDRDRIQVALAALLERTASERVSRIVLDLTGAADIDDAAADGLLRILRVLRLQGVAPVLSGIHPRLVHAILAARLDLGGVPTFQTLEDALRAG
ncbi:Anti-anti-sigma regulatory factor (antagonist of anti-sigma factor) [Nannocystis exedens]|uniref:Anti-anti-sigma regulatory factor (Antagonist of anti-sigma factor) n=1 Tax=Nannocystis exedens TaxID=54 RepID=A0A1I2CQH3_9BACT|nr:STAS domain-containing protein [Nannocystis exedens]PCC68498.1 histidine kinase [Nannocystis exedens]SFE70597.1 Anti-anti-sigma regulatory factor (antagonist of anti-sigma factor) [Nannocystis exedens]